MPENFDPYRKWLGIPPKDQPPHHYRLLGIELFENDPDVIDHAADRQMTHVRAFQSGKHSAVSQKLLTELSAARLCLLSVEKKGAYDAQLRARLPAAQPVSIPTATSSVPVQRPAGAGTAPVPPGLTDQNQFRLTRPAKRRASKSSTLLGLSIAGLAGVAILLFAGFIYRNLQPSSPALSQKSDADRPVDTRGNHDAPAKQTPATVLPPKQPSQLPALSSDVAHTPATEAWISREATYTVSSTGEGVLALPSLLTDDDPDAEYAVHTRGGEAGAHILIDLGAARKVTRLEIINRRDPALYNRAKGVQLWLAAPRRDSDARFPLPPDFGREVWTAEEGLARYDVRIPQPVIARYVKLGFPPEQIAFLHLAKVRVYGYK